MKSLSRYLLLAAGATIVVYSVFVLAFVATSPDLRLRCLLVDIPPVQAVQSGLIIQDTDVLASVQYKPAPPNAGDVLLQIGDRRIHSFVDFTAALMRLRGAAIEPGGQVHVGFDPSEYDGLLGDLWLVEDSLGQRLVKVKYWSTDSQELKVSWLLVQSIPLEELLLSLIWFVLQLGIFLVGALAYWHRSFDRTSRLFFVMCIVTMGAFVGGYHWWVIAGSQLLNAPFIVCAVLVPPVTLHFFLTYPRSKPIVLKRPLLTLAGLYAAPAVAIPVILGAVIYAWNASDAHLDHSAAPQVLEAMGFLRLAIYTYVACSAFYFVLTICALVYSVVTTRNPIELNQVKWILYAAVLASIPVSYALYLAHYDRVGFALGRAGLPMFIASLCFMLAYAVGIVRYRMMLVEGVVSKGVRYYVVSFGLTLAFGIFVAAAGAAQPLLNRSPLPSQLFVVFVVLMLSVMLLLSVRDRVQQLVDRRFFREKYKLDKALERMNRVAGHLVEPVPLAQTMLGSCRDALRIEHAALYLRNSPRAPFELVASDGHASLPLQCTPDSFICDTLQQSQSVQRVTASDRDDLSPVQHLLRALNAELIHALEVDGVLSGIVALGRKSNGGPFTAEDLTFLTALVQITKIALHSVKVHQDISRLNEELRLKVEKINSQTRQIALLQSELTSSQDDDLDDDTTVAVELRRAGIKGNSAAIRSVLETVRKVAGSESTVLIRGESGTGKELLAQVLHENSPRHNAALIRVHCAALSPSLLESELFGHVKGAFTGAHQDKQGRFEMADGGTLFLDEIGDIPQETQIKLLRVLQERCFEPVGGNQTIRVDVRLITATHQNLEKLIVEGRFREDLYYRLNVISVTLPPLRERKDDLFELSLHFLNRAAQRIGKRITHIDDEAFAALEQYHWPGNIRELQNVIERAVVLTDDNRVTLADLPEGVRNAPQMRARLVESKPASRVRPAAVAAAGFPQDFHNSDGGGGEERAVLLAALNECGGNKAQAARRLGMPRSTFFSKLKKHAIV